MNMTKKKYRWQNLGKKTDPEQPLRAPLWLGNHSNGEYFHTQTKREKLIEEEVLKRADSQSRYLGMDRREFLSSSMGMVTTMAVINQLGACASSDGEAMDGGMSGNGQSFEASSGLWDLKKGPYVTPPEAMCEDTGILDGDEFIMDVQTHSFDDGPWRETNKVYPIFLGLSSGCSERADPLDCTDQDRYGELMFVDSDTTVAVITSWPASTCFDERKLFDQEPKACGLPLSNVAMRELRDWINEKAMSQRVINQVQVMPNDNVERQIDGMQAAIEEPGWGVGSWKCYPAWRADNYLNEDGRASGYFLDDPVGRAFIEAGLELGVPNFAVHKGLPIPGFDVEHNQPLEMGRVARAYPDANFVVYHSGINAGTGGGALAALNPMSTENVPYDNTDTNPLGVNMLIRALIESDIIRDPDREDSVDLNPRLNVWAEMGGAWGQVMGDPNEAQHYIGKLLKYLGEDNIVWGTDCILSGSPQGMIEMFRGLTITEEYQEKYGYPAITDAMKAKILGLNAAKIYRVDPEATRCNLEANQFAQYRQELDGEFGDRRWTIKDPLGPRNLNEFWGNARWNRFKGVPG